MTDKVQKIRKEVERLQDLTMDKNKNFYSEASAGEYYALCNIEHFIDSLQEEPVSEELEEAHIWKPADGDDLPEIDREVVAFQKTFPTDIDVPSLLKIVMAHRPNPKGYDGKSIATGKVEHYTPKTYDKGGWNIPNIKYWLDVELPKEIEL